MCDPIGHNLNITEEILQRLEDDPIISTRRVSLEEYLSGEFGLLSTKWFYYPSLYISSKARRR